VLRAFLHPQNTQARRVGDLSPRERSARHQSDHSALQAVVRPTAITETGRDGLARAAAGQRRAVQWLADNTLIDDDAAGRFLASHPDPDLP
jgi:hypothetical protein